jgi:hypothetical protein
MAMTLSPWMRVIQQSWTYHIVVAALIGAARQQAVDKRLNLIPV